MVYAGLLAARKKAPTWRMGRAQTWMRGHLWLGLASLPLILLHAGFSTGEALTSVLVWLLVIVIASGVAGAWLQHALPKRMLREVPMETVYEQIDHVRSQLLAEADGLVANACGKLELQVVAPSSRAGLQAAASAADALSASALATTERVDAEDSAPLRDVYLREVRSFLAAPSPHHPLADAERAAHIFEKLRAMIPPALHAAVADLENICEEERQLMKQQRLHLLLHAWQLVHVPLSSALLVLSVVHIVMALGF
jgi:hypothetical protein